MYVCVFFHFSKISGFYVNLTVDSLQMIPTRFIRRYGESLSNLALIKLPNGAEWKLELAKCDGKVWLKKGWREFMEYSSLKQGHLLVFRYEGKSHFCVLLFDESATEIDYPFNSSPGEDLKIHEKFPVSRMEEMESDISVERLDDFPAYPKTREKSPLSCPRPRKMMRTNSSAQIRSTANLSRLVPHSTKNKLKEANLKKSKGQAKFHSTMQEFEGVGIFRFLFMLFLWVKVSNIVSFLFDCKQKVLKVFILPRNPQNLRCLEGFQK